MTTIQWKGVHRMVLTDEQIRTGYFDIIPGFPSLDIRDISTYANLFREVKEYGGQQRICISCTQLPDSRYPSALPRAVVPNGDPKIYGKPEGYSPKEQRQILKEWIDFLRSNPDALKGLHFCSHAPQRLFDAACCQVNLEELRFKWGNYRDLSALENLQSLKFLYIGTGAGVTNIQPICSLKSLVVLHVENFKRVEDYSALTALENLEELTIRARIFGRIAIKDLEFLRDMPNLRSFATGPTTLRKKYTKAELEALFASLPNLKYASVNGKFYGDRQFLSQAGTEMPRQTASALPDNE